MLLLHLRIRCFGQCHKCRCIMLFEMLSSLSIAFGFHSTQEIGAVNLRVVLMYCSDTMDLGFMLS